MKTKLNITFLSNMSKSLLIKNINSVNDIIKVIYQLYSNIIKNDLIYEYIDTDIIKKYTIYKYYISKTNFNHYCLLCHNHIIRNANMIILRIYDDSIYYRCADFHNDCYANWLFMNS